MPIDIRKIEYLALSQGDKPTKQFRMKNCMTKLHILGSVSIMINRCVLAFHQMFVFKGKTHNLQTRKYDVVITSPIAKKYLTFYLWNTCFLLNIPWKFCEILNIFHGNIKENVSGCFFRTQCSTTKYYIPMSGSSLTCRSSLPVGEYSRSLPLAAKVTRRLPAVRGESESTTRVTDSAVGRSYRKYIRYYIQQ